MIRKLLVSILLILFSTSAFFLMGNWSKCWPQSSGIAISVLGDIIKIRGYYKNYQLSVKAVANMINQRNLEAIRSGAINHFAYDPILWNAAAGRQIVESELALQAGVVEYLERKIPGADQQKRRILNSLKESIFYAVQFLKESGSLGMVDKKFYDIQLQRRQQLTQLLRGF